MISAGCGDSAAGRESSEPQPLRTDARLRAEVRRGCRSLPGAGPRAGVRGRPPQPSGLRRCGAGLPSPGARRRRKVSCALRAPRSPRWLQRGPGRMRAPGGCGPRAPGCGGPDPVRRRRRRRGVGARAGAVTAAAGRGSPEALPLQPRRDCGTSGGARIPAPRPGAGRVRRPPGREPQPGSPRPASPVQCVFSECAFLFQTDLQIWPQQGGSSVKMQPYNRMGILLSVEKGQRGKEGGAVPFPREN